MASREHSVSAAFIAIANNMVGEFDLADLLGGLTADCARLLDIRDAGLVLADGAGMLQVAAATSEDLRLLQQVQLDHHEGPCLDCYAGGAAVQVPDLSSHMTRWPNFASAARKAGYASVHALPLRLQDRTLGALGLFGGSAGTPNDDDLNLAQALAHAASIALVVHEAAADQAVVNAQLQTALSSRVVLEQAKGIVSESGGLDINQAFEALRRYSRNHNQKLTALAQSIVDRRVPPNVVLDQPRPVSDQPSGRRGRLGAGRSPAVDHSAGQVAES